MERFDTEKLNENDSVNALLTTPHFTQEAEDQAVPVEKLPEPTRANKGLFGILPVWFLVIGLVATLVLGVVGGVLVALRDNRQQPTESSSLAETPAGESNFTIPQQPGAAGPVNVTSQEQVARRNPGLRRETVHVRRQRVPLSPPESPEPDLSQNRPVARKVGVITGSASFEYRRTRANQSNN